MASKSLLALLLAATTLASCSYNSPGTYMGAITGATIGDGVGGALGLIASDRHNKFEGMLLGRAVGTAAGAIIGYNAAKNAEESKNSNVAEDYDVEYSGGYNSRNSNYQISGGYSNSYSYNSSKKRYATNDIEISDISFQDENGDGKFSRDELCYIVYYVSNTSSRDIDLTLFVTDEDNSKCFAISPETNIRIGAHKKIKYTAKVYCKRYPAGSSATFRVNATTENNGSDSDVIRIRMKN